MSAFPPYVQTDLAVENALPHSDAQRAGIRTSVRESDGIRITELEIFTPEGARQAGRPMGMYYSLDIGKIWYTSPEQTEHTARQIAVCLDRLRRRHPLPEPSCTLIAGLGNRAITADCLGPRTLDGLNITRHLKAQQPDLYRTLAGSETAGIVPGVVGQTGVETTDLLRAVVQNIRPGSLIAVDALAARSTDRLATTVQLTDTGISPGSGIGNHRMAVSEETLGIPVIAIGIPTVVNSSTLVYDALEKAGMEQISEELQQVLDNGRSFFVSLKEIDLALTALADLLARAINLALDNTYA